MHLGTKPERPVETLLIGRSAAIVEVRELIRRVATSNASVLITGPSGTGKELVARAIHAESNRANQPFVPVNCGAIPRTLLESELFGHEKGSFTGAVNQRRGQFEEADTGTLFLDEIGDMPLDMQVKLLRVLEERKIQRVGGRGEIAVDVRIVSATHQDIDSASSEQRFRQDLFYRLAVFPIHVPALAERSEDIPLLVRHFLRRESDVQFTDAGMQILIEHPWPGNIRELRNVLERASIMYRGKTIGAAEVRRFLTGKMRGSGRSFHGDDVATFPVATPMSLTASNDSGIHDDALIGGDPVNLRSILSELEHRYVSEALDRSNGVVAEAARLLSLQRTTLIEKMRKHGLSNAVTQVETRN